MDKPPQKMDSKTKHKIELMIILLVITVLGNIGVYYLNHNYEKLNAGNFGKNQEVVKEPTSSPKPTARPIASPTAIIAKDCLPYKTTDYTLCLPKNWVANPIHTGQVQFQPKSIPVGLPVNYLSITLNKIPLSPIPTPVQTYTQYKTVAVGNTVGYRTDYIPQKSKDGFILPIASGCQDPYVILIAGKSQTVNISSCKQYEKDIQPLLDSLHLDN